MDNNVKGAWIATAVAGLFVACASNSNTAGANAPAPTIAPGQVKCVGLNACKAQGVCAQGDHACGGKNACKGQGVTLVTAEECTAKGGKAI
jgi:hypothetical protein